MLNWKKWFFLPSLFFFCLMVVEIIYAGHDSYKDYKQKVVSIPITFSSYIDGNWQIWSIKQDGSDLTQITHISQDVHSPAWSPDRNKLAYVNNEGEIWILEPSKIPQKAPIPPQKCANPSWSPDGTKLTYVCFSFINGQEESDIWITELSEERYYKLFEAPGIQKDPEWSPDGKCMLYSTGYWTSDEKLIEEIWIMDINMKIKRPLIADNACNIQPSWSPDGNRIAFASDRTGNMEIWIINISGKNKKQLTNNKSYNVNPCWSSDGDTISFISSRGGKMDIWIMDKDGGNERKITDDSKADFKDLYW